MEEVDNIIIHSLREIGCDIDGEITNLSSFSTESVVEATVKCLDVIRPGLGLSTSLPANMAARFRLGATLAQACTELGYRGDIGYQTFLYNSEIDLRRLFMFLIDKLPKECDETLNEPSSQAALLGKSVASIVSQQLSTPWLPHYCYKRDFRTKGRATIPYRSIDLDVSQTGKGDDYRDYYIHYQQPVPNQTENSHLLPSVLSYNIKCIGSSSTNIIERIDWLNSQHIQKCGSVSSTHTSIPEIVIIPNETNQSYQENKAAESPEEVVKVEKSYELNIQEVDNKDIEIESIKSQCEGAKVNIEELQNDIKKLSSRLTQITTTYQNEETGIGHLRKERNFKIRSYDLLENAEENIMKLDGAIESSKNKIMNLAVQWEKHRGPLIWQYRGEREKHSTKASASKKKLDEARLLKEKERELLEECRNKDQRYSQLVVEVQKLPKEVNRSAYTQRILEIINNVRKQRDEINKVLEDTRDIQKEINTLTGRLERSFTVVDEMIFRDARTNEASRKAYKLLATLHADCSDLVILVEETGAIIREIRDLEEQIDSESTKNVGANLERITADLKQMRQETAALTVQLQGKNS